VTSFHTCGIWAYNNCAAASVHVGTPHNLTRVLFNQDTELTADIQL